MDLSQLYDKVTLTKVSDDVFDGKHPNNIQEGYEVTGYLWGKLQEGASCIVSGFITSPVTEIVSEENGVIVFKTKNSTYKLKK